MSAFSKASKVETPVQTPVQDVKPTVKSVRLAKAFNPEVKAKMEAELQTEKNDAALFAEDIQKEQVIESSAIAEDVAPSEAPYVNEHGEEAAWIDFRYQVIGQPGVEASGWFTRKSNGAKVHFVEGVIHREDGPAEIYPNGSEIWKQHNRITRNEKDGPAFNYVDSDGNRTIAYYENNELHAVNNPARTILKPDGSRWIEFYTRGLHDNAHGAAVTKINKEGNVVVQQFMRAGLLTRNENEGPADIWPNYVAYMQENELHRLGGPAMIVNGKEHYYLQGLEVDQKAVSMAFLDNRNAEIGKAKKANIEGQPVKDHDTKQQEMVDRIEQWKKKQNQPKSSAFKR